jgi:flagellar export protein FliJ
MKKFKFTLQTVHDLRESRREKAERELADANSELYRANAQLEEVVRARQKALDRYMVLYQSNELDVSMIGAHTDFLGSLFKREQEARVFITEVEMRLEEKRRGVTEAMRETETTAKLRDRQREVHRKESNRHEQTMLDEMAAMAAARRQLIES